MTTGIIIQWDVCVNDCDNNLLEVRKNGIRILVDKASHLSGKIQPFDYTLCHSFLKPVGNFTKFAYPTAILMPDQVIELVKQGVTIISNLLPWDVLSDVVKGRNLSSEAIVNARIECNNRSFVFGSYELRKELKKFAKIAIQGLEPEKYAKYHLKLANDTGRLNVRSRKICYSILYSEGKALDRLLEYITQDPDGKLRVILSCAKESATLEEFRKSIIQRVFKTLLESNYSPIDPFKLGENFKYTKYNFVSKVIKETFFEWFKKGSIREFSLWN